MENSYKVGVFNRYALFLDGDFEDTDGEISVVKNEKIGGGGKMAAANPKKTNERTKKEKENYTNNLTTTTPTLETQEKRRPTESKKNQKFANNVNNVNANVENNENNKEEGKLGRSRTGGTGGNRFPDRRVRRGGGAGSGGGGGGSWGGRRETGDRRSGSDKTGVKRVDKREGSGPRNWGSNRDLITDADEEHNAGKAVVTENEEGTTESNNNSQQQIEEKQPEQLTLDEWKALKNRLKKPVQSFNLRKAGEGEDLSKWRKMYELRRNVENSEDSEEDLEDDEERTGRKNRQQTVEIEVRFNDEKGRGRPRRGGGVDRGSSRKMEKRENATTITAPKVDDEKDFPSLSATTTA